MEIMVSVLCMAYNHEKYIRQCLEGFVKQKTTFPFEVLINDDASTDRTADIIREYEKKYPHIIKPIYQTENQYSKNIRIGAEILLPMAKGKYIAMCEGDDYWSDLDKLQKQFAALQDNPECHMCVHTVRHVTEKGQLLDTTWPINIPVTGILNSKDFLKLGYIQTNSYFMCKEDFELYAKYTPQFAKTCFKSKVGDQALLMYFGNLGSVYYFAEPMSCYRKNSIGSWTLKQDVETKIAHFNNMEKAINEFNEYSNFKFQDIMEKRILKYRFWRAQCEEDYRELIKKKYNQMFSELSIKYRIKIYLGACFPRLIKKYNKKKLKKKG